MRTLFKNHKGENNANAYTDFYSTTFTYARRSFCIHCCELSIPVYMDHGRSGTRCDCKDAIQEIARATAFEMLDRETGLSDDGWCGVTCISVRDDFVERVIKEYGHKIKDLKSSGAFEITYAQSSSHWLDNKGDDRFSRGDSGGMIRYNVKQAMTESYYGDSPLTTFMFWVHVYYQDFQFEYKKVLEQKIKDVMSPIKIKTGW